MAAQSALSLLLRGWDFVFKFTREDARAPCPCQAFIPKEPSSVHEGIVGNDASEFPWSLGFVGKQEAQRSVWRKKENIFRRPFYRPDFDGITGLWQNLRQNSRQPGVFILGEAKM